MQWPSITIPFWRSSNSGRMEDLGGWVVAEDLSTKAERHNYQTERTHSLHSGKKKTKGKHATSVSTNHLVLSSSQDAHVPIGLRWCVCLNWCLSQNNVELWTVVSVWRCELTRPHTVAPEHIDFHLFNRIGIWQKNPLYFIECVKKIHKLDKRFVLFRCTRYIDKVMDLQG